MSDNEQTDQSLSAIDKALNAAKARKETKAGTSTPKAPKAAKEPKKPRLTDEEKVAKAAAKEQERLAKKAERAAAKAARIAERNASKQAPHLKKVQRAAERLGQLDETATSIFNEATTNLTAAQLTILASHLNHFNRVQATNRALNTKLTPGMAVEFVGGDPKLIGKTGTVFKAQRIRAYITVEGYSKPIYVFTSDVAPVTEASAASTATA